MTEKLSNEHRPLSETDLIKGAEFTMAKVSFVKKKNGDEFQLKIGDTIRIEKVSPSDIRITVNGHLKSDQLSIPIKEISELTIVTEN